MSRAVKLPTCVGHIDRRPQQIGNAALIQPGPVLIQEMLRRVSFDFRAFFERCLKSSALELEVRVKP